MKDVEKFLIENYSEYRRSLESVPYCEPFAPYGWLDFPGSVDLIPENGMARFFYKERASESARTLANDINGLINATRKLEAWCCVIGKLEAPEKLEVLREFVWDTATVGLIAPYTIKARFFFATAYLSHHANFMRLGRDWVDDFAALPEDRKIVEQHAIKVSKPWSSWKKLINALNQVDGQPFKAATDDFRRKYNHRLAPQVEIGLTQPIKRTMPEGGVRPNYIIDSGSVPISLEVAVAELKIQCRLLNVCFTRFQALVAEQSAELFPKS
jgi:hypothetical protein